MEMQVTDLRLVSYNCNSIRKKVDVIRQLLDDCDILLCQEIVLLEEDLHFISSLSNDFNTISSPSRVAYSNSHDGRPSGGSAIFWRKSLDLAVETCTLHFNYSLFTVSYNESVFGLANIYMPCDMRTPDSVFCYETVLGELQCSLDVLNADKILLIGDFNADPSKGNFWPRLNDFILYNNLVVNDLMLPIDTFTYLSPAHNSTSWLDHIISSDNCQLSNISIIYDKAILDYFPIAATLSLQTASTPLSSHQTNTLIREMVNWKNFDLNAAEDYNSVVLALLDDTFICSNSFCTLDHNNDIDEFYDMLVEALKEGTRNYTVLKAKKFVPVPGWNQYCKELHAEARSSFLIWLRHGKIRYGSEYEQMKSTRKDFVNALKYCKENETKIRNDNLARSVREKNVKEFWREVQSRRKGYNVTCNEINNLKSPVSIANMFATKFSSVSGRTDHADNGDESLCQILNRVLLATSLIPMT